MTQAVLKVKGVMGLILLPLFFSCQSITIRPDPNPSSFESNYPSLLVCSGSECENGLLSLSLEGKEYGTDLDLKIHVFYEGKVFVHSETLGISESFQTSQTGFLSIPLHGVKLKPAVLFISFQPTLPDQTKQDKTIYGLHAFVTITSETLSSKTYTKISQGSDRSIQIPATENDSFFVANMSECGSDLRLTASHDGLEFLLSQTMDTSLIKRCLLIALNQTKNESHSLFNITHAKNFSPLSIPLVRFTGDDVLINSHATTTITGMDQTISNKLSSKFKRKEKFLVYSFTHKGRSIYGFCDSLKKECSWKK